MEGTLPMKLLKVALIGGALLAAMFAPATASAAHWDSVEQVSARVSQACVDGTKIDDPSGTYGLGGGGSITIVIHNTAAGQTLEFTAHDAVVTSLIIKGGPITVPALKYNYSPGEDHDTGLHASLNPNSGKWYGVSHICITSSKKDEPPK
jgi:hypothetical protein